MEDRGIDPGASRMRIERSTIWARPPRHITNELESNSKIVIVHLGTKRHYFPYICPCYQLQIVSSPMSLIRALF